MKSTSNDYTHISKHSTFKTIKCRKCGSSDMEYRELSDIYEDYKFHCLDCDRYEIAEGSDY